MSKIENKQCQNCGQNFTIEPDDFTFYEKIQVPAPTWCPTCRNVRRMAWREASSLYRDACKMCGKSVVSIHSPDGPFTTYCRECWTSDRWDPMNYGKEYDFNMPFFIQYRKLMEAVPRPALTGNNLVQSDFAHGSDGCKNCYFVFFSYFSEQSQNSWGLLFSRDAYDSYVTDNSDHVYETLHCNRLYRLRFGYFSDECLNSAFLFDCVGCSDCFGCINLRKRKLCLFNKQLHKNEYLEQLQYWDLGSYRRLEEAKNKFYTLYLSMPHRYARVRNSTNVTGDVIRDTKDCQICFSALDGVQNCKYIYLGGLNLKDSYDISAGGDTSVLLYESLNIVRAQKCYFAVGGRNIMDVAYSDWVSNSSDIFGCIGLKNKRYCILNRQYGREDYEALVAKIKKHMETVPYVDKRGRKYGFGEFFPTEISAYAYNESLAFSWYPKNKDEVLKEGWNWREPSQRSYKITRRAEDLPDHIHDVGDSILQDIIECVHAGTCNENCATAFRLTKDELEFYRNMNIALPRLCPNCRFAQRLRWRNGFTLWHRKCQCESRNQYQNTSNHFHGDQPCPNEFETSYAPDRPEIIYCDQCYKAEFF